MYCFVSTVLFYVLFVCKCVLPPLGVNPIAAKYIIYHIIYMLREALDTGISLHWGTWRGFACRDFWEKRIGHLGSFPFLDPQDIKILSLGAIRNFGKGTGLSW